MEKEKEMRQAIFLACTRTVDEGSFFPREEESSQRRSFPSPLFLLLVRNSASFWLQSYDKAHFENNEEIDFSNNKKKTSCALFDF